MTDIKVIGEDVLIASSRFLSLWKRTVEKSGKQFPYFMAVRGSDPPPSHSEKKPDAVVVIAFWDREISLISHQRELILTSEYRIPLGCRELGFPAGSIEESDYEGGEDFKAAACNAAVREMKEETGYDFTPIEVSPNNLYSSPGMTNESVVFVFGFAKKSKDAPKLEELEDIEVMTVTHGELVSLLDKPEDERDFAFGKTSWPFLWAFKYAGFYLHTKKS